jgi:hypothetical protein
LTSFHGPHFAIRSRHPGFDLAISVSFLLRPPAFQLFLASDRSAWIPKRLEINQLVSIVLTREVMTTAATVLRMAPLQTVCNSNVQNGVPLISQNINKVALMAHYSVPLRDPSTSVGMTRVAADRWRCNCGNDLHLATLITIL